jgi:hypothetical protein
VWCREISAYYLEKHSAKNVWIIYWWNFPLNIFRLADCGEQNHGKGGLCDVTYFGGKIISDDKHIY